MPVFVPEDHPPFTSRINHDDPFQAIEEMNNLECSTQSTSTLGRSLSAFRLGFTTPKGRLITVESAYQGSKVFEHGGPFQDIYDMKPAQAKKDERVRTHGRITAFHFFNRYMPCMPINAFYNWLYLSSLVRACPDAPTILERYDGFIDRFFHPTKGRACQAEAVSMVKGLHTHGLFTVEFFKNWKEFYEIMRNVEKGNEIK